MTPFEFGFALLSLLLGLGFAVIADNLAKLVLAGRAVRWDWLSPLVAINVFQTGLIYWWFQWSLREQPLVLADLAARAVACLVIYILSVGALPQAGAGQIDLRDHFTRSRALINSCFIIYIVLVSYGLPYIARRGLDQGWETPSMLLLFVLGLFVTNRWFQTFIQLYVITLSTIFWMAQSIKA